MRVSFDRVAYIDTFKYIQKPALNEITQDEVVLIITCCIIKNQVKMSWEALVLIVDSTKDSTQTFHV